jgi:hypothetical protein
MKNSDCLTTYRYHMPHVVVFVVPYVAPVCWRPRHCCTPIAHFPLAYVSKQKTLPSSKSQNNSKECQIRPLHGCARSPTIERLFELAPRTLPVENPPHPLAAWWEGRARRDTFRCRSLSLVRIPCCRLVPPDLCGFPDGSPQRDRGKTPGKSAGAFAGGSQSGTGTNTAPKMHTSRAGSPTRATRHVAPYLDVSSR